MIQTNLLLKSLFQINFIYYCENLLNSVDNWPKQWCTKGMYPKNVEKHQDWRPTWLPHKEVRCRVSLNNRQASTVATESRLWASCWLQQVQRLVAGAEFGWEPGLCAVCKGDELVAVRSFGWNCWGEGDALTLVFSRHIVRTNTGCRNKGEFSQLNESLLKIDIPDLIWKYAQQMKVEFDICRICSCTNLKRMKKFKLDFENYGRH
jgi:hypothetical protein